MSIVTKTKGDSRTREIIIKPYSLILENDDKNTFDYVISCLINICGHTWEQANQCATITHLRGRCDIKRGDLETILDLKEILSDRGLLVTIEKN
jgi:ATP-dependent Clp protease adaptor protein ClpS